ncbi:MAG: endo alpha-1,4 polygalactosaminidase [Kiritimatiellae bacterium]|nr:endo alpha-1,4 polygalactosaminidase [Kiritimatiellia bacterium]
MALSARPLRNGRRLAKSVLVMSALGALHCAGAPGTVPPPASVGYVLQYETLGHGRQEVLQRLAASRREWLVLEPAWETGAGPAGRWSRTELEALRAAHPGRRLLAYLSIGEAEDYRDYWVPAWDANRDGRPDPGAPRWLLPENPDWEGNYRVRYWSPDWQAIVLAELARCLASGFDGLYLDIVDAFETFEYDAARRQWIDHRRNPETGRSYRADMIEWVRRIAAHARELRPGALIVPQNGEALLASADYRAAIDAVALEDLWSDGHRRQDPREIAWRLKLLQPWRAEGGWTFTIEYPERDDLRRAVVEAAARARLPLLLTDRELQTLGTWVPVPAPPRSEPAPRRRRP